MQLVQKTFGFEGQFSLDLDQAPGRIEIKPGKPGILKLEVSGPERYRDDIVADFNGLTLKLRGPANYAHLGDSSVSVRGASISISSSGVTIGAKHSELGGPELCFTLEVPDQFDLKLGSVGKLSCEAEVRNLELASTGLSNCKFGFVEHMSGKVSGGGKFKVRQYGGRTLGLELEGLSELNIGELEDCVVGIDASGGPKVSLTGNFAGVRSELVGLCKMRVNGDVKTGVQCNLQGGAELKLVGNIGGDVTTELEGISKLRTEGDVGGDYIVTARGISEVTHKGSVNGKVSSRNHGLAKVNI